ncbi:MAG: hypothetical protein R2728_09145 [Chitinophagales bacterium]
MINVSIKQIFTGHAEPIYALASNDETSSFYSGSGDGFVGEWSLKSGRFEKPVAKSESTIYSLLKMDNQPIIFIGLQDGVLNIIDTGNKSIIKSLKLFNSGIFDMAFLPRLNWLLLASGDGNLGIVDATSFTLKHTIHLSKKSLRCVDVSPCGDFAIIGASDHQLYFLDFRDGIKTKQTIPAHKNSVFTAIYKEGYSLLTGGRDALLKEWDWLHESKEWGFKQSIEAHNYTINKIAKHPSDQWIATSSRDKTIKIWNFDTLKLLKVINLEKFQDSHTHSINTLLWIDNETLLSAGDDKKIIAWKITS